MGLTLPETGDLSSAKIFAECIPSDTRQKSCLPSAAETALGKIMALNIPNSLPSAEKKPLDKLEKNTRQNRDTQQKPPCGHPLVSVPAVRSLPECPLVALGKEVSFPSVFL